MAANKFTINATLRSSLGKGASRRLRREQKLVPAILYGGTQAPTPIAIEHDKLSQALENVAFYSHILDLNLEGAAEKVILRELQRHPFKRLVLHADFQRVASTDIITMRVPLRFINQETCPGAKAGGIINHQAMDVEVRCKAEDLPEYIEINLSNLQLNEAIHLSGLNPPAGVEIVELTHGKEHDVSVVSVHLPRASKAVDETANNSAAPAATADKADKKKAKDNKK